MKLLLFFLFSFLVLFLFFLFFCTDTSLLFLDFNYNKATNYIPYLCEALFPSEACDKGSEETHIYSFKSNSDTNSFAASPASQEHDRTSSSNCISINCVRSCKNNISIMFNGFKNDTKLAMHKMRVFDRTLS